MEASFSGYTVIYLSISLVCRADRVQITLLGVPQGSLLGPRPQSMFSIYVSDFPKSISQGELHLYAEDTTAYVVGESPDNVLTKLNRAYKFTWYKLNKLTLHTGKSELVIIQQKKFVGPLLPIKYGDKLTILLKLNY